MRAVATQVDERLPACGLPDQVAQVLWRAHRAHAEKNWCPLCREDGPCTGWIRTRLELLSVGLVFPHTPVPGVRRG